MISDEDYGREAAKGVNERYPGLGDVVGRCLVGWEVEIPVIVYRGLMVKLGDWLDARAVSDTSRVPESLNAHALTLIVEMLEGTSTVYDLDEPAVRLGVIDTLRSWIAALEPAEFGEAAAP